MLDLAFFMFFLYGLEKNFRSIKKLRSGKFSINEQLFGYGFIAKSGKKII